MKTKVLLLVDDKAFIKNLTKDLEKVSCAITFPKKQGVLFSVFEDVPHVIVIDEDYENNKGRRIATEIKDDVVLKYIPIILVVRDDKSVLAKDHLRIDTVVSKTKSTKGLVKIIHETFQSSSHELDFNPLTHLPGIHTAVVKIDREIDAKNKFAVLCADLSNLGAFNAAYGDIRGDEVIIRLSEILKKAIRLYGNTKDFLCHLGGDDFIILTTTDRAVQIAEVIVQNFDAEVQSFYDHDDRERGYIVQRSAEGTLKQFPIMNVSVAIVENDLESYQTMSDVSRAAGELVRCMTKLPGSSYARIRPSKPGKKVASGQDQYEIHFPGKMKSVVSGNGVPSGIEEYTNYFYAILKDKKIKTLYQPVLDIKQRKIVGYEALTRPTLHYPSNEATTLFSVARQTNHVKDLDKLCIEFALKNAQTLSPEFKLFLNLNHETLLDHHAMFQLFSAKGSIGFKNIVIEVTEQSILRSFDKIRDALAELKEQGVSVAIDDVGGGAVSLRDVALLKPDYIKFDRLLVRQVDISTTKQQILLSLILFSKGIVFTNFEYLNSSFLSWMAQHYWVVNLTVYAVLLLEMAYPFLIWGKKTRPWILASAIIMHLGIIVSMKLYFFGLVAITAHLSFIRHEWIAWLRQKLKFRMPEITHPSSGQLPQRPSGHFLNRWLDAFAVDLRSLALFRITIGLLLLADIALCVSDLRAHYTDFGVLPRSILIERFSSPWEWSLFLAGGNESWQWLMFGLAAISAVCLIIGYRTALALFVSWVLLVSSQHRNFMVLQGGDVLFRMLLFWSLFLPLGSVWSLDRVHERIQAPPKTHVRNFATLAFMLQMIYLMFFTALHKTDPSWSREGTAVYYALMIDQFATPLTAVLLQYPLIMKILTWITFYMQLWGVWVALLPIGAILRTTYVFVMILMQVGFSTFLELGLFPWVVSAGWLIFLPAWFWDKFLRTPTVSTNPSGASQTSTAKQIIVLLLLIYVTCWNIRTLDFERWQKLFPRHWNGLAYFLGLEQEWNMFSPRPLIDDGWFVIPGKLVNGQEVDLFRNGVPVRWEKPHRVATDYPNQRWRKYMMNLWRADHSNQRLYYGQYLCRQWNENKSSEYLLKTFDIYFIKETTLLNGKTRPPEKLLLWSHRCFDEPPKQRS